MSFVLVLLLLHNLLQGCLFLCWYPWVAWGTQPRAVLRNTFGVGREGETVDDCGAPSSLWELRRGKRLRWTIGEGESRLASGTVDDWGGREGGSGLFSFEAVTGACG